jgi:hypothetical protein
MFDGIIRTLTDESQPLLVSSSVLSTSSQRPRWNPWSIDRRTTPARKPSSFSSPPSSPPSSAPRRRSCTPCFGVEPPPLSHGTLVRLRDLEQLLCPLVAPLLLCRGYNVIISASSWDRISGKFMSQCGRPNCQAAASYMSADSMVARRAEYAAAAVRWHLRGGGKRPGGSRQRRGLARSGRLAVGTAVAVGIDRRQHDHGSSGWGNFSGGWLCDSG